MAWTASSSELSGKIVAPFNRLLLDLDRVLGLRVGPASTDDADLQEESQAGPDSAESEALAQQSRVSVLGHSPIAAGPQTVDSIQPGPDPDFAASYPIAVGPSGTAPKIANIRPAPVQPPGTTLTPAQPQQERPDPMPGALDSSPESTRPLAADEAGLVVAQGRVQEAPLSLRQSQPRILRILPLTRSRTIPVAPESVREAPALAVEDADTNRGHAAPPTSNQRPVGALLPLKVARAYRTPDQERAVVAPDSPGPTIPEGTTTGDGLGLASSGNSQDRPDTHVPQSVSPDPAQLGSLAVSTEITHSYTASQLASGPGLSSSRVNGLPLDARSLQGVSVPGYWPRRETSNASGRRASQSGWLTLVPLEAGRVAERLSEKVAPSFQQAELLVRNALGPEPGITPRSAPSANQSPNSTIQNNFNVSVSLKSNGNEVDLAPEVLEEAIVNVLKDAARRHGLEV